MIEQSPERINDMAKKPFIDWDKYIAEQKAKDERIAELESKIEAAKEILGSQSFWCELADQECVGLKSIVYLVDKALKGK